MPVDNSQKRVAIVPEVTAGTTPSSPSFLTVRDVSVEAAPDRQRGESRERRADRRLAATYPMLHRFPLSLSMDMAYDATLHKLFEAALQNTFSTHVLKDGSTPLHFTLEEKYEEGSTDYFYRYKGLLVSSVTFNFQLGQPIGLVFACTGLSEETDDAPISGATYSSPTTVDPMTPIDVVVTDLFGLSSPKVLSGSLTISNNVREKHAFGAAAPFELGLGAFRVEGDFEIFHTGVAAYDAIKDGELGDFQITIGHTTNEKYSIECLTAQAYNPRRTDGGNSTDPTMRFQFKALYDSGDTSQVKITKNVS